MVPTPAMRAMRCRGAQNRAAPFFPPTALRRTVPPQQGGARVFLTTVLPYWFTAAASLDSFPPRFSWEDDPAARSSSKSVLSDAGSVGARHSLAQQESCG